MTTETKNWEIAKVEYESALTQYRHYTSLRRQDMIFAATVQAAVLTIVGKDLLKLDFAGFLLSFVAFFALLTSINAERRLTAYMTGFVRRATQIESEYGMSFLASGKAEVDKRKLLLSNTLVFPLYHFIFILSWIAVWTLNVLKIMNLLK